MSDFTVFQSGHGGSFTILESGEVVPTDQAQAPVTPAPAPTPPAGDTPIGE